MSKDQGGPSFLRFQLCQSLDTSSVVPAPGSSLIRGLYPKCVCFHPTKPLMAVGVSGYLAVYDLQSNTRVGRVDLKSVPVEMAFAPEGSIIVVVVQDWILYSVSTTSWRARQLVPKRTKMDKPLESCLLAVAPGLHPFIYFCRYGKDTLRLATLPTRAVSGSAAAAADGTAAAAGGKGGPGSSSSGGSWGTRVKLDVQKAVLGLACHHMDAQLLVLTADGQLRGYAIAGAGGDALMSLYAVQVQDPADKVVPSAGVLLCVPHPALSTGALILQGSRLGTAAVLELPGRSSPLPLLHNRIPGYFSIVGMGICRATGTVLAFGLSEGGRLRCTAWKLSYRPGSQGVALRPSRLDPQDLTPLLDNGRRNKAMLASSMATCGAAAGNGFGYGNSGGGAGAVDLGFGFSPSGVPPGGLHRVSTGFGGVAPAAAGGGGTAASAAASWQATSAMCHGLWGVSPAWAHDVSSSCLLDSPLGPVVGRVVVHPTLGLVAVAPEPARPVVMNRDLMFAGRGGLSMEEEALARRTSSISLLHIHNLEAASGGWRGAGVAPQHTPLTAWMPRQAARGLPPGIAAAAAAAAAAASAGGAATDDDASAGGGYGNGGDGAEGEEKGKKKDGGAGDDDDEDVAPIDGSALVLPPHVYYLAGNRLMKYSLVTRAPGTIVQLPTDSPDGDNRLPRQLLHSPRRGAWLVFLESGATGLTGGGAGPSPDRFLWTLLNGSSFAGGAGGGLVSWIRQGKSGCFLGPDDAHYCIMASSGKMLEVYDTDAPGAANPLLSVALEGAMLLPGLGSPVFPGPPMTNAPVPEARAPPDAMPHDARRFRGSGVVLWQSSDMALSMTTLPALMRVPLDEEPTDESPAPGAAGADDSSDDDAGGGGGPRYYPNMPVGHFFGQHQRQAHLPLLPNEVVLHVAWQSLVLTPPPPPPPRRPPPPQPYGSLANGTGTGPADAAAAVLTSQRLLVVTAALRLVCAVNLSTLGSPAVPEPLSSVMWAGPVLLLSTAAGQVLQLSWTGTLLPVCTLSPTGHVSLLGVTSDALLLLRTPLGSPLLAASGAAAAGGPGGAAAVAALAEVVARPLALLQPLLVGWASLAATGLLSYGPSAAAVRSALRWVLASYDASTVTPRGIWSLIAAGAWDVAAAVASHMPPLDSSVKLAAAAAAGDWAEVKATLLAEASRSLHAPAPPPPGSELHSKLMAAAAGALFHGQLTIAGALFQAAGEWPAAMLLAVCQGNVNGANAISHQLTASALTAAGGNPAAAAALVAAGGEPPSAEAKVAAALAAALRNVYGGVGTPVGDLTLSLAPPFRGAEPLERAERWTLAAPLAAPAAVAVRGGLARPAVPATELGAIPPCIDRANAVSYYGLTATATATVAATATSFAAAAARGAAADRSGGAGASVISGAESSSHRPGGSTAAGDLETNSVSSSDAAQAAARAEFLNHQGAGVGGYGRGPTIDFSSDSDSGSEATASAADGGGGGGGMQRRIKIQIRDRGGAGAAAAGDAALREAAKGLKLAPPGAATAASQSAGPLAVAVPAAAAAGGGGAGSPGAVHFPPGMSSLQLYTGGATRMEAGDWRGAAAHFSRAMSVLQHEERAVLDEQARRSRLAFCAQYYAAVLLLEAVAGGTGPREARLYRYLAGLNLDPKHANALLREAITRNRAVGNHRYAADQLTALIGRVADTAPGEYLAQLQAEIEECDRHGGRNAGLPADEQVSDWAMLVGAAGEGGGGKQDVDALVLPLLSKA